MAKQNDLISSKILMEQYFKFRSQRNGEHVLYATISPPDMDKIIKATMAEMKLKTPVKDGVNDSK